MARKKILIVSEDPALLKFLRGNLSDDKYQLMASYELNEGIEDVLSEVTPCLVILDIMMPQMSGIEISLYIRQQSQVPILMFSTWGSGEQQVRALDLCNVDSYLSKPFGVAEVITRIERSLLCNQASKH